MASTTTRSGTSAPAPAQRRVLPDGQGPEGGVRAPDWSLRGRPSAPPQRGATSEPWRQVTAARMWAQGHPRLNRRPPPPPQTPHDGYLGVTCGSWMSAGLDQYSPTL